MNTINSLLEKIERAPALDFGTIFNQSIELFKKVWVQGLVVVLLTMLLMLPLYFIIYIPMIAMGFLNPETMQDHSDFNPIIMIPFGILALVFTLIAIVIGFGMKASFFRICKLKDLEEMGNDDYFFYLKRPYLGKTISLSLATFGISVLAMLLCVFPIIYVMVPITLMNVVYAFNPELSTSEMIKASFKLGNKKWLLTFGLVVISGFLSGIVGFLMCCIGIYVTMSFAYIPVYFIYKESIGFNKEAVNQDEERL
ncbi:MAG: hypothetical protein KDC97_01980 [Confluentibacter sp.]|nr:hypothetical protein [Confluentibacter sp.]HMQ45391.1 hypothetical protein [Mariniflexile sp.]HMR16858.1 hypothetical protein [Mariniflexile sp.]